MFRFGLALFLLNLVSTVGALVAAVLLWDENRTLAYIAIVSAIGPAFLPTLFAGIAIFAGFGLFVYALTENQSLSFLAAFIGAFAMFAISIARTRQNSRRLEEQSVAHPDTESETSG